MLNEGMPSKTRLEWISVDMQSNLTKHFSVKASHKNLFYVNRTPLRQPALTFLSYCLSFGIFLKFDSLTLTIFPSYSRIPRHEVQQPDLDLCLPFYSRIPRYKVWLLDPDSFPPSIPGFQDTKFDSLTLTLFPLLYSRIPRHEVRQPDPDPFSPSIPGFQDTKFDSLTLILFPFYSRIPRHEVR